MIKRYTKKLISVICSMIILASYSPAYAANIDTDDRNNNPEVIANIIVTDPESGRVWEWEVPVSDIQNDSVAANAKSDYANSTLEFGDVLLDGVEANKAEVSVDLSAYLAATGVSSTLYDDINVTTGLYYNVSGEAVSITSVFGSTVSSGIYYASNRKMWWRNPGAGVGSNGTLYPTTNSWSYPTDATYGLYSIDIKPYSLVECEIHITGMSGYRTVSIQCSVSL
ncbi:MAG: hypothetical protein K0R92_1540 [Lachnospiraceae bacterium]|jgi:hypothetical protein|nr:hypothetical protein [Lachnospiraceae bacterium]